MRILTRKDLVVASSIVALALLGAVLVLLDQPRWALLSVIALLAEASLLFVVTQRSHARRWEKEQERFDRVDATGRSFKDSLARANDRLNKIDRRTADLASQLAEAREQNVTMANGVGVVVRRANDLARDLYDLNLAVESHQDAIERAVGATPSTPTDVEGEL